MNAPSIAFSLVLTVLLFLAGCAAPPRKPIATVAPKAPPVRRTYWNAEGVPGSSKIVVGLREQRAYFYKANKLVGESPISSGRKGFETPTGTYRVIQKDEKHVSNLYGDFVDLSDVVIKKGVDLSKERPPEGAAFRGSPMPFFLRFESGYGLHAGRLPGHRASHGCIRLPREMARRFYEHSRVGTPVIVQQTPVSSEPARH